MRIVLKRLQDYVNRETKEELTLQDEMRKFQSLRLSILEQSEEYLQKALKNNDTAMVAAIAEILKTI